MKIWEKLRPALISLFIGLVVFIATGIIWQKGYAQSAELWFYDQFVYRHSDPNVTDSRIVEVLQDENDIKQSDYPIRDKQLSEVLEKIESGSPAVIGLDLYRDLPDPRDGIETPVLNKTLTQYPNIVCIFLLGDKTKPEKPLLGGIPPPPALITASTRYGFNNFPDDKVVRRAFLLWPWVDKLTPYSSFALTVAETYLANQNISLSQDGENLRLGKTIIPQLKNNDGGYINDPTGGYAFMQDYRGPKEFKSWSIHKALALQDSSIFKDKIVMIGIAAVSSNDTFTTPVTENTPANTPGAARLPGVTIHAQIVNQLLRMAIDGERPVSSFSQGFGWFWIALWTLCGVAVAFLTRSHIIFALTVSLGALLLILWCWIFFLHGYWVLVFAPLAAFLVSSMLVKSYIANFEDQQRKSVMKLFSQHVSPDVAEAIWNQREMFLKGGRPEAQRMVSTVLFTDLKDYSTLSEKMTPHDLMAWVNECLGALAQHVGKNNGIIDKFIGDAIMAIFGFPIPRTTETEIQRDAINAVRCAVSMSAEIRKLNIKWKTEGKPLAGMRIGIHTGELMAGVLGSDDRLEYTVIGDSVNTASRLEGFDKEEAITGGSGDCRILISEITYQYIKDAFSTRHVGSINLKGKKEATGVYKVLDLTTDENKIEDDLNKR